MADDCSLSCLPVLHTLAVATLTGMLIMGGHPQVLDHTLGYRLVWLDTLVKYWAWLLPVYWVLTLSWLVNVSKGKPGY